MSFDINHVVVSGRLARDPEVRTAGSTQVAQFSVVNNWSKKNQNGQWEEQSNFFNCKAFGHIANSIAKHLHKGSPITVEGELRFESWEKDGQKRSAVCIMVSKAVYERMKEDGMNEHFDQKRNGYQKDPESWGFQDGAGKAQEEADNEADIPF